MKKISIITPVHNGADFIEVCLQNVIDQACSEVEHIIVDGGSVDGTVDVIRRYAAHNSHIRWISEVDRGQSDAMNKGIAMAVGEIIGFLNVDDFYESGVLRRVMEIFEELPEPSLLVGNCNVWDSSGGLIFINRPQKLRLADLLLGPAINPYPINPSAYFYHKSLHDLIGPYDVDEHYALDLDFLLRAVQVAHIHYVNETWGNFRMVEGTKSVYDNKLGRAPERREKVMNKYWRTLPAHRRFWLAIEYLFRSHWLTGLGYYASHPQEFPVLIRKLARILGLHY